MNPKPYQLHNSRVYHDATYLTYIDDIFTNGTVKGDRTGTGTISLHGAQAIFDMSRHGKYNEDGSLTVDNFPLLTTKKMNLRNIIIELLWFVRGETNILNLVNDGVNIWNDWPFKYYNQEAKAGRVGPVHETSKEHFVNQIIERPDFAARWGELGPVYGKQWREWEGKPTSIEAEPVAAFGGVQGKMRFEGKVGREKIDQLAIAIDQIKMSPDSRRIIVMAWNPADIAEMAKSGLPPCHMSFQFFVRPNAEGDETPYLDMEMYQRSCDSLLGVPYNIASYAALLMMVAKECKLLPGKFIHHYGDAHIYLNHVEQLKEQLTRVPYRSPTLTITGNRNILRRDKDHPDTYKPTDFQLKYYECHPAIKGDIAV